MRSPSKQAYAIESGPAYQACSRTNCSLLSLISRVPTCATVKAAATPEWDWGVSFVDRE